MERLDVILLGRGRSHLVELIERAERNAGDDDTLAVWLWTGNYYTLADRKPKRPLDTIFVPEAQKQRLVDDLSRFIAAKAEYRRRGTPWRRGLLLEGPPGTGKSSLIFALASNFDRPVYLINLNTVGGDTGLQMALSTVPPKGVAVIEDIDCNSVTHDRDGAAEAPPQPGTPPSEGAQRVTLSGLLNAIDGVGARDGRILFITTNRAEVLDPALLRPGRVDHRETVGLIDVTEAEAMARLFLPEFDPEWFACQIAPNLPMAPAALQQILLRGAEADWRREKAA